jgi:electron transport complex protein RnfG
MNKNPCIVLCIITIIAGLALGATYLITKGPIEEREQQVLQAALGDVFPGATFAVIDETPEGLDGLYEAKLDGELAGYVGQITVSCYKPGIVIVLGVDLEGKITGINVGGTTFAESPGFGTRTREPEFTTQFIGLDSAPVMGENVDAISGVTISSKAVIGGTNSIYTAIEPLLAK